MMTTKHPTTKQVQISHDGTITTPKQYSDRCTTVFDITNKRLTAETDDTIGRNGTLTRVKCCESADKRHN